MTEPSGGAEISPRKSDAKPALLGVACGAGAALFWALGFVATRHGLKVGFTPPDLLMHRFLWSGLLVIPIVLRAGIGNLCGIGWGRGLVLRPIPMSRSPPRARNAPRGIGMTAKPRR